MAVTQKGRKLFLQWLFHFFRTKKAKSYWKLSKRGSRESIDIPTLFSRNLEKSFLFFFFQTNQHKIVHWWHLMPLTQCFSTETHKCVIDFTFFGQIICAAKRASSTNRQITSYTDINLQSLTWKGQPNLTALGCQHHI